MSTITLIPENDCSLFSRLYIIASQIRDVNLDDFFAHENQVCPPSMSHMGKLGKLRTGTKLDLLGCLDDLVPSQGSPNVQVSIIWRSYCEHVATWCH